MIRIETARSLIELIDDKIGSIPPDSTKHLNEIRQWNRRRKELIKYVENRKEKFKHLKRNNHVKKINRRARKGNVRNKG